MRVPSRSKIRRGTGSGPLAAQLTGLRAARLHAARTSAVQLKLRHLALQGVAMDAENFGGFGAITAGALQHAFDHAFFQNLHGLFEEETSADQMCDQIFES